MENSRRWFGAALFAAATGAQAGEPTSYQHTTADAAALHQDADTSDQSAGDEAPLPVPDYELPERLKDCHLILFDLDIEETQRCLDQVDPLVRLAKLRLTAARAALEPYWSQTPHLPLPVAVQTEIDAAGKEY